MNLAILFVIFLQGEPAKAPKPEDYPVSKTFSGKPAAPKLVTSGQRRFRTMIRDAAKNGANFAGHYAIAEWGCGTGCVQMVVVDVKFGNVSDGPFGTLPGGRFYLGANPDDDKTDVFYHLNSSLLILRGCPNFKDAGTYYYSWTGTQFKLIRKESLKGSSACQP